MVKKILQLLPLFILSFGSLRGGLQDDIYRAESILSASSIPSSVLKQAKGVVIMSILKGGFIFSGKIGSGLVVARLGNSWSAPSALGMGGAGWGLQVGASVTDFVLILNTQAALDAFSTGGSVSLGGSLSVAVGPVGGTAEGAVTLPPAAIYSYSRSKGLFAGVSLEGAVIVEKSGANQEFYGRWLSPREILSGDVEQPKSASGLYSELQ